MRSAGARRLDAQLDAAALDRVSQSIKQELYQMQMARGETLCVALKARAFPPGERQQVMRDVLALRVPGEPKRDVLTIPALGTLQ